MFHILFVFTVMLDFNNWKIHPCFGYDVTDYEKDFPFLWLFNEDNLLNFLSIIIW